MSFYRLSAEQSYWTCDLFTRPRLSNMIEFHGPGRDSVDVIRFTMSSRKTTPSYRSPFRDNSCETRSKWKIQILYYIIPSGTLEGERPQPPYQDIIQDPILRRNQLSTPADNKGLLSDLVVTVEIFSDGRSLALPTQTSYKPFTTRYK